MKNVTAFLIVLVSSIVFCVSGVAAQGTDIGPTVASGAVGGSFDVGRPDAGLVVRSLQSSDTPPYAPLPHRHAMVDLSLDIDPCDPAEEALVNASGRDSNGDWKQMGSISWMWTGGCSLSTGYSVLRLNAARISGPNSGSADMALMLWADRGVGLFRNGNNDHCGGRFLCITRTLGSPSIVGTPETGMVIEGALGSAAATPIFLNSYNSGNVRVGLGGGRLQLASNPPASSSSACATGEIAWDTNYTYVCISTNVWKRTALSSW